MAAVAARVSLASKFRGCLVGSHVGDCFGAPFEFTAFTQEDLSNHVVKCMQPPDTKGDVEDYTDDTAMTLCIADSLIANKSFNVTDIAKRFYEEYDRSPSRGYGGHVAAVFESLKKADDVFEPAKQQFNGTGSYGNGAAMRIAPVALFTYNDTDDDVVKVAKEQSLITHFHQHGYNGAILQCLAIRQALKMSSDEKVNPVAFIDSLLAKMEQIELPFEGNIATRSFESKDKQPCCNRLKKIREIFEAGTDLTPKKITAMIGNGVAAQKSVPMSIYAFLKGLQPSEVFEHPSQFVQSMYHAVSVGGDTDTIAAMTGSICGAYHGFEEIPESFQARCEAIERSVQAADALYELCFQK